MTAAGDLDLANGPLADTTSNRTAVPNESRPDFAAHWELDLAAVQSLIDDVTSGCQNRPDWVEALLYGARIVSLDERAVQVVGSAAGHEGMIGQPVASFAPPDSWATMAELIVGVASDRPKHSLQSRRINSFMLNEAVLKVWGPAGDATSARVNVAVEGAISDDRSHWAVRASEARYRKLIHHLPNALLQTDARLLSAKFHELRAGGVLDIGANLEEHMALIATAREIVQVTDANQSAVNLLGAASAESLLGPVDYLFAAAPETAARVVIAHFEGKRSYEEMMKLRTFDGRMLDVQLSITFPSPPERLDITLISLEDVTGRLRTETQLRQLQAEYGRATRFATLGELASSIAHEVNQPLSAIAMNAETSLRWLSREDVNLPKVIQLTTRIAESAHHASEVVQRIRGMAGRHVPERVLLDLNQILEEALLFVHHDLEWRSISLVRKLPAGLPQVFGDRVQLQQVIVNLLINAIQAIVQKGPVRGRIELGTGLDDEGAVFLSIHDNGTGIAAENLDRIFDGFFTTKDDGMGIGLAVCQSIIVAHGGKIEVENHPAGGALIRFSIPAGARVELRRR